MHHSRKKNQWIFITRIPIIRTIIWINIININLKLIHKITLINKFIKFIDIIIGHGLILTKRDGKFFFIIIDSLKHNINKIGKTYAWIIDIEISKTNSIFWIIIENGKIIIQFIIKFLNKVKIKCPEIKFDDNRIDEVIGRIINLINSIITIKRIENLGEFNGTKCLRKLTGQLNNCEIKHPDI